MEKRRERETVKADETTLLGRPGDTATPGNGGRKIMYTTLEGTEYTLDLRGSKVDER